MTQTTCVRRMQDALLLGALIETKKKRSPRALHSRAALNARVLAVPHSELPTLPTPRRLRHHDNNG